MKKRIGKFGLVLALILQSTMGVYAVETNTTTIQVETTAGNKENVEVKVTTDTSVEGINNISSVASQYVTESGMIVDYTGSKVISTHEDGTVTGTDQGSYTSVDYENGYYATGGYESEIVRVKPTLNVDISLEDEDNLLTEKDDTTHSSRGRVGLIDSDYDDAYNYTEVNVSIPSVATITTKEVVTKEVIGEEYQPLQHIMSSTTPDNGGKEMMYPTKKVVLPQSASEVPTISEGYEFVNLGISSISHYWAAVNYRTPDPDSSEVGYVYTDGVNTFYSHHDYGVLRARDLALSGIYVNGVYVPAPAPAEGQKPMSTYFPAKYDTIQQFYLSDKDGNIATTYCVDQTTTAEHDFSYKIKNLEDAGYYDKDSENMIRSIALNGYWGSSSGLGSLEALKAKLRETNNFTEEELEKLTDGVAMTATQYAIWTFSNHMDDVAFLNAYYRTTASGYPGKGNVFTAPKESSDVLFKLYEYLIHLEPTTIDGKESNNTIINEDNFIERVNVQLFDKPETAATNLDDDIHNDIYLADVAFELAVRPRTNKDTLYVTLVDDQDQVIASGQIAGVLPEGKTYLKQNEQNQYVFEGVELQERTQGLNFYISGEQYIDQGVYLYSSETIDGAVSQTMIGVASGNRNVDVRLSVDFSFSVDDEIRETRRVWRRERSISPVEDVITGKKYLDGKAGEGFEFTLSDDKNILETVTSDKNGEFTFESFVFTEPGIYTYKIKETVGDNPDIIYDKTIYTIVYTIDANQGVLSIASKEIVKQVDEKDVESDIIDFNNKTIPPERDTGDAVLLSPYVLAMSIAGLGIVLLTIKRRKMD